MKQSGNTAFSKEGGWEPDALPGVILSIRAAMTLYRENANLLNGVDEVVTRWYTFVLGI